MNQRLRNMLGGGVGLLFVVWVVGPAAAQAPEEGSGGAQSPSLAAEVSLAEFVGIYAIDRHTRNPTSCEAEGDSIAESGQATHFVALTGTMFGETFLSLFACAGLDDCRSVAEQVREGNWVRVEFTHAFNEIHGAALRGVKTFNGYRRPGAEDVCADAQLTVDTLVRDGNSIRVESRVTRVAGYPANERGHCSRDDLEAAAAEQPCAELTVLVGSQVEGA